MIASTMANLLAAKGQELTRAQVERGAYIMGQQSAYAHLLAEADAHCGPARFWRLGNDFLIERIQARPQGASSDARWLA